MKFSIIINTHNQKDYIVNCILSCIRQNYKNFELIIVDSSKTKISNEILKKLKNKLFKYIHINPKFRYPELNQLNKIEIGVKKAVGKYIVLLDGDDEFNKDKLLKLNNLINKKDIICNQDYPLTVNGSYKYFEKIKKYKYNFFFRSFINEWPQIYGTSSIFVRRDIIKKFFNIAKPYNWRLLAIDAQLILFCKVKFNISSNIKGITFKNLHNNNLGSSYLNIFKKKFWIRRNMQHHYYSFLKNKLSFNVDFLITKIIYLLIKNL